MTAIPSSSSTISTDVMRMIVEKLKGDHIRKSTKDNYYCVWKSFNRFFIKLDVKPETWEDRLVLYVGYLVDTKKKSQTIKSYISAIKSVLKNNGVELNEDTYLINALTRSCRLINDHMRTRLPIRQGMLNILLRQLEMVFEAHPYLESLYKTIFASAYFGLLRVGELTKGNHPIKVKDVHIADNKEKILFILRTSKTHGTDVLPQTVKIESTNRNKTGRIRNNLKKISACIT